MGGADLFGGFGQEYDQEQMDRIITQVCCAVRRLPQHGAALPGLPHPPDLVLSRSNKQCLSKQRALSSSPTPTPPARS